MLNSGRQHRSFIVRTKWLLPVSSRPLENAWLRVERGLVTGFGTWPPRSPNGLQIIDLSTQDITELTTFGSNPDWALSGDWIAFESGWSEIWKVRPNGSDLTLLKNSNPEHPRYECIGTPRWSPDTSYILYGMYQTYHAWHDVYKMKATGRTSSNLTGDTEEDAYPVAWVEEPTPP